ncbi:MAG TPA: 3-keto-5-aminohexanoate cleavage protein [Gemmatimonadales bacterium]|nr:3-keto-5-aminohexanoate cleavage protein [Gemmatimonadales bacterium]
MKRSKPLPHPLTAYPELIVNFCPTGMIPTKAMTPHVAITPAEVIDDACRALELGVSIVHLHAREADGSPTYRGEIYEKMILGIRGHFSDAIICVSCSGRNFPDFEQRSEVLELTGAARPDLASLTLTSLDFPTGTSQNAPDMVLALGDKMVARGIKPELECFDFGMINAANMLIAKGLLGAPPYYFNLLLGSRYSVPATARHLSNMLEDLPPDSVWSAAGIGLFQLPMNTLAIAMGGHCRVGLEDNIYQGFNRNELATNPGLVARVKLLAETFGRRLASPARARELLGLTPAVARKVMTFDYDELSGQPTYV